MRTLSMATLSVILVLSSCAKAQPVPIARQESPVQSELSPGGGVLAVSDTSWYAQKLEQLGFYVFPTPEELPPVAVVSLDGKTVGFEVNRGKVTILNFWATWCPPCRAEMPSIQALYDKTRDVPLAVMAISVNETRSVVEGFLKDNPYGFPVYLDESGMASSSFVTRGIPTTFILDKRGRAIAGLVGSRSYDGPEVVAIMKELAQKLSP